jgi:hypothetical protein
MSCIPHGEAGKPSQGSSDGVLAAASAPTGTPGTAGTGGGEAEAALLPAISPPIPNLTFNILYGLKRLNYVKIVILRI